jgi:hypothetical protein
MTPGLLLAVIVVAWLALLAGLWRLSLAMDRIERLAARLDTQSSPGRGPHRG